MEKINSNCACPNVRCKRHGNCKLCRANHGGKKMYCNLKDGSFRKWVVNKIFRANSVLFLLFFVTIFTGCGAAVGDEENLEPVPHVGEAHTTSRIVGAMPLPSEDLTFH